ncbi:type 1 fimbrial protein, partial [Salmonella enterica]|nr:type 1 fimbrial protein [Salmonella enterica]
MKKYTLPLCGLAISLGMVSSAMAAPVTGSQTISGTLTAPTCTISMPTDYKIPDVTISAIDARVQSGNIFDKTEIGGVGIKNCDNVSASAMNSAGVDPLGPGSGRFIYENAKSSTFNKEPLIYQLRRLPNSVISDGRVENMFRMNGTNSVVLKDGDSLNFTLVKGRPRAGQVESSYIGGYHADVTFTFNYS